MSDLYWCENCWRYHEPARIHVSLDMGDLPEPDHLALLTQASKRLWQMAMDVPPDHRIGSGLLVAKWLREIEAEAAIRG